MSRRTTAATASRYPAARSRRPDLRVLKNEPPVEIHGLRLTGRRTPDDRRPPAHRRPDSGGQQVQPVRIEAVPRLVQEQDLGTVHQRQRQPHTLPLSL